MSELDVNSGELLNLKALAANRAGFARNALFDRVAGLLFEGEGELTPEVRTLIDQILTGLIHQVEAEVRQHSDRGRRTSRTWWRSARRSISLTL